MGYVVLGAGAIGAVVGGRLCQAGFDVTLLPGARISMRCKPSDCVLSHR
jgi:ketopantoate reductase